MFTSEYVSGIVLDAVKKASKNNYPCGTFIFVGGKTIK